MPMDLKGSASPRKSGEQRPFPLPQNILWMKYWRPEVKTHGLRSIPG